MLMNANGIQHTLPVDPNIGTDSITSGNKQTDDRFMQEYMMFHQTLAGLARDYKRIQCQSQSNGVGLYLHLYCY